MQLNNIVFCSKICILFVCNMLYSGDMKYRLEWIEFKWLRGWFANGLDFKWDLKNFKSGHMDAILAKTFWNLVKHVWISKLGTITMDITIAQPFETMAISNPFLKKSRFWMVRFQIPTVLFSICECINDKRFLLQFYT